MFVKWHSCTAAMQSMINSSFTCWGLRSQSNILKWHFGSQLQWIQQNTYSGGCSKVSFRKDFCWKQLSILDLYKGCQVVGFALGENQLKTYCFFLIENPYALKINNIGERFSSNIPHSELSKNRIRELSYQVPCGVSCMVASRTTVSNHFQTNVESTGNPSPLKSKFGSIFENIIQLFFNTNTR